MTTAGYRSKTDVCQTFRSPNVQRSQFSTMHTKHALRLDMSVRDAPQQKLNIISGFLATVAAYTHIHSIY